MRTMVIKFKNCCWLITILVLLSISLLFPYQDKNTDPPSQGSLSKVHNHIAGMDNCIKCHTKEKEIDPAKCLTCHKDLATRIQSERGYHRDKKEECGICHQEHQGDNHQLIQWDITDFDHSETGYQLTGLHKKIKECQKCHNPGSKPNPKNTKSYLIKDNRCSACHQDAHRGNFPNCTECHSTREWKVDIW
jgi:hypothetical protein